MAIPSLSGSETMQRPRSLQQKLRSWRRPLGLHILLGVVSLLFAAPLLWMVSSSLKSNIEIFQFPPSVFPHPPIWSNYPNAFNYIPFWLYAWNSFVISGASVVGTLFSCPIAAYGFARLQWRMRSFFFALSLSTIMLPYLATMVPL